MRVNRRRRSAGFFRVEAAFAAPAETQIEYLQRIGTAPSVDKLALELDDIFPAMRRELSDPLVSRREHRDLWTLAALKREEWHEVRRRAQRVLDLLEA